MHVSHKGSRGNLAHKFLENKPNVAGNGPKWLFDIDTLTMSMNYHLVVTGNQPNDNAGIKENLDAGKVRKETISAQQYVLLPLWSSNSQDPKNTDDNVADDAFEVKENENDVYVSANESDTSDKQKHDEKAKRYDKGKSPVDSLKGVRDLRAKFEEFSFNSTNRFNAISDPINAAGPNPTNSTNSFNTASPSINDVSPNFGIARQSSFVDPSKYPDDPEMPKLEDIVYSDDEEDVGAEADLSNLETNIPVSPILTTRVHKDHPVNQIIGALNLAPQTRSMTRMVKEQEPKKVLQALKDPSWIEAMHEELLQFKLRKGHTQEEGIDYNEVFAPVARIEAIRFENPVYPDKVYKVVKALYGLHQALKACYETLANYLLENDFQRGKIDQTLFIKKQKGDILLVQVFMDDIIFGSTNKELCTAFEKLMKDTFQMNVKSASTPIETEKPLLKDLDGEDVDVHLYQSMIGSLMYLHPDQILCLLFMHVQDSKLHQKCHNFIQLKGFLGVNTPRCDEDSIELKELMVFLVSICVLRKIELELLLATATVEKVNGDVQLQALIDDKKLVVTKAIIRRDLHLDDADGVECLPNAETFEELARMGYEKPPPKLTFYQAFFSMQWNSMASAVICLATGRKFNFSKYIFGSMVRNVDSPRGKITAIDANEGITLVDVETDEEEVALDAESQGRTNLKDDIEELFDQENVNAASKGVSAVIALELVSTAEPTVFDDEDVTMTMAQTLIKLKADKARILDEKIAQKLHDVRYWSLIDLQACRTCSILM
nr:hypothetical protein [Tanacetum cinerariifolium]